MEIYLARSRGFCAGVASAVDIVDSALRRFGAPLYVYHEIVHNTYVVNDFRTRGVIFVESIDEVPAGQRLVFSAHGVPPEVVERARQRGLKFVDATCPLVTKVHNEAVKFSEETFPTVLIGHKGHQELIGTAGYVRPDLLSIVETEQDIDELGIGSDQPVAYLTQTTLSVDETRGMIEKLKGRFPRLVAPPRSDICYATQNRQDSVRDLAGICDKIIICGSPNSSNSNRLRETGANAGVESYIVDRAVEFDTSLLKGARNVGISSGASVPECVVEELVARIQDAYPGTVVHRFENPENDIAFKVPRLDVLE